MAPEVNETSAVFSALSTAPLWSNCHLTTWILERGLARKLQMSTASKPKRRNRKRDEQRLATFLTTKCIVCDTPREMPSRRLPCCDMFVHEGCLLNCFRQDPHCLHCGGELFKCPRCHSMLFPINGSDEQPEEIPVGYHTFRFEQVRYEPEGATSQAAT